MGVHLYRCEEIGRQDVSVKKPPTFSVKLGFTIISRELAVHANRLEGVLLLHMTARMRTV